MRQRLDNPVLASLESTHAGFALRHGAAARYPAAIAPFIAADPDAVTAAADFAALVEPGESVLVVGPCPVLGGDWQVENHGPIAQMVCDSPVAPVAGPEITLLDEARIGDMLALTALVYPHYFRAGTPRMGRYLGIYDGARLAAMAGERMGFEGHQEISTICTHPDYLGRGYAQRLLAELSNGSHDRGRRPFLHVSHQNVRAKSLYERMGYVQHADIGLWSLRRGER